MKGEIVSVHNRHIRRLVCVVCVGWALCIYGASEITWIFTRHTFSLGILHI